MTANHGTVESSTNELQIIRQKPMTKASEHRRITKPIMEKKRRARINNSLNELKSLILDALNKDPTRHSKLEKADILEMTVRHLQKLQRQQIATTIVNDPKILNKYRSGYSECANEIGRYMNTMDGFDQTIRQRILGHLQHCINSLNQLTNSNLQFSTNNNNNNNNNQQQAKTVAFPDMVCMLPSATANLHVQIPSSTTTTTKFQQQNIVDINNNNIRSVPVISTTTTTTTPPPSSASSLSSIQFAFNLHSPPNFKSNDFYYNQRKNFINEHTKHHLANSPGSMSTNSEQMISPIGSDDYQLIHEQIEMAVDCTISSKHHSHQQQQQLSSLTNDENVWRPW